MKELVIASRNQGKIAEFETILADLRLLSLVDIAYEEEIAEPYDTFEENALAKASAIYQFCGKNVFADDSGLCIHALGGAPGVVSAHYSGTRNDEGNLEKVLRDMQDIADRRAYYKAVICLIWNSETYFFEGICEGAIAAEKQGTKGFGYDPIFIPDGFNQTFGELEPEVKNAISHRGKSVRKMAAFIARASVN
jgi:XTP/dITP diphosphohydrolase